MSDLYLATSPLSATDGGPATMPERLKKGDWKVLLQRINDGECTPFLGAGASYPTLQRASEIAREWAKEEHFPFDDCNDLAKVAQFLSVTTDSVYPKKKIIKKFRSVPPPNFENDPDEPHRVLAELPLKTYITTNYDDFMFRALEWAEYAPGQNKTPRREVCQWNTRVDQRRSRTRKSRKPDRQPDVQNPIVFHLHGHVDLPESIVLTEDDYLDFLISIGRDEDLLPPGILEAFTKTSLLFVGYGLNDWNFRVLFRSVVGYLEKWAKRVHISVQLEPLPASAPKAQRDSAMDYLNRYFQDLNIRVYWGDARDFVKDLRKRWETPPEEWDDDDDDS